MKRGPLPTLGSKRHRAGEYKSKFGKADTKKVVPPDLVRKDPKALAFWNKHADTLIADGRLKYSQADTFGMLCLQHSKVEYYLEMFNELGPVTIDKAGRISPNPVAVRLDKAQSDFVTFSREFGMTPAAMARLPSEQDDGEEDEGEALLKKFTG